MDTKRKPLRAFELDALRGSAIVMMMLHHLIYDLRYIIGIDAFAWQETSFFNDWVRAPFLFIFLFVSGICCTFSRNNFLRALKMAGAAALFSLVFLVVSLVEKTEMYIFFNVLHLLALGTLVYALLEYFEKKGRLRGVNALLILFSLFLLWLAYPLSKIPAAGASALLVISEQFSAGIGMADYMPIVPWFGMFLLGALFGRLYYKNRQTLFPGAPESVKAASKPFEFVGRHALLFYILHQPVLLSILYLLKFLGIIG